MPNIVITMQAQALLPVSSLSTTATVRGVSFTFDRPMPVGYYADTGEPFVQSSEAFNITSISPASASDGTYQRAGAMKFAGDGSDIPTASTSSQGLDERLTITPGGSANAPINYSSALNVDPAVNGNIAIAQGENCTIMKVTEDGTGVGGMIGEYVILTIQGTIPSENALRPPATYCDAVQFDESDIDLTVLASLTPPSTVPTVASVLGDIPDNADDRLFAAWGGEQYRRLGGNITQSLGATINYGGDTALERSRILYKIQESGLSEADRMSMAKKIIRFGMDAAANELIGVDYDVGAGQHHGWHSFVWFAAFLLQSDTLLSAAKTMRSNMQSHPRWVTDSIVGRALSTTYWPGANTAGKNWYNRVFDATDLGKPDWIGENGFNGASQPGAYKTISLPVGTIELLPVLLLQNGPTNNRTGEEEFLRATGAFGAVGDGNYDTGNALAAAIAVMDRWQTWTNDPDHERDFNSTLNIEYEDYYAAWRPQLAAANWSGVPDCPDLEMFSVGSGNGEIDWNVSTGGGDHATETITSRDIEYSLDGIQFINSGENATSGTLTGLLQGTQHFLRYRANSASGNGKWTRVNIRNNDQEYGIYGVFTTTGTPSGVQSFTTAAQVHYRTYPTHDEPVYTAASGTLPKYVTTLYAGAGYVSGDVSVGFTYQWQKDTGGGFADISGETGQSYSIDPENDQGVDFQCVVTCGSASSTTDAVTVNTGATPAAGVLFETDFDGDFFLDWAAQYNGLSTNNATLSREPGRSIAGSTEGAVIGYKTGGQPRLFFENLPAPVQGTTYDYEIDVIEGFGNWDDTGLLVIERRNNTDDGWVELASHVVANLSSSSLRTFSGSFSYGSAITNWRFRLVNTTQTGLASGGDLAVTRASFREAP